MAKKELQSPDEHVKNVKVWLKNAEGLRKKWLLKELNLKAVDCEGDSNEDLENKLKQVWKEKKTKREESKKRKRDEATCVGERTGRVV